MIVNDIVKQGRFLFRWRSFLPLLFVPVAIYYGYSFLVSHKVGADFTEELVLKVSICTAFFGFFLRCLTVGYTPAGTSGRNTTEQLASVLNTTGMYSLVRHPLYLANYITFLGFVMVFQNISFVIISSLVFFIYYERIIAAEEDFLKSKFGEAYAAWSEGTPTLFPTSLKWKQPKLPFSFRKLLRREPPGFLLICVVFFSVEFLEDVMFGAAKPLAWLRTEYFWTGLLALGLASFAVLWLLRKKTSLLNLQV
jgi:protein-S-isoprenylcysteine O-methyltransferase Ste14